VLHAFFLNLAQIQDPSGAKKRHATADLNFFLEKLPGKSVSDCFWPTTSSIGEVPVLGRFILLKVKKI
jgi:hypothetical protein